MRNVGSVGLCDAELRLPRYHAQIIEGGAAFFRHLSENERDDRCGCAVLVTMIGLGQAKESERRSSRSFRSARVASEGRFRRKRASGAVLRLAMEDV